MKRFATLAFPILFACCIRAQNPSAEREVIAAAGDFFVNSDGSLSWTLGEVITETFTNSNVSVVFTQGFQQPDNYKEVGIPPVPSSGIFMNLYPNPASRFVILSIKYEASAEIKIELLDMLGRIIHSGNIDLFKNQESNYRMDVSPLSAGMYMVRLTEKGKPLNSYKFQKVSE